MLLETYRQNTHNANSERIGKQDSLSEFISGEVLDQMRQEAMITGAQGVRAYFGRYPDNYTDLDLAGRQSLVFTVEVLKYSPNRFIVSEDVIAFGPTLRINKNTVDALLTTYRQISHKINSERIGKEDSSSVLLSLEILDQIREEIVLKDTSGIHAYFGRYPNDYIDTDLAGRQTLVLTVGDLKSSPDGFIVPEGLFAFFDMPFCPPVCNCGGPGLPSCH